MSEKKKKVPVLRFPGFSGEWEERKLSELATFSKGNGYTKGDLVENGKPIILYGRLYTKYETVISEIDTFVSDDTNAVLSQGNEVIVPASGETAEDIARASVVEKQGIILGGDLNIIRPKSEIQQTFLALSISNGSQQKEMMKRAQGKSVVHLHNSDLKEVHLKYPSLEEQLQIGKFFNKFDHLIALHQRKLTHLQARKKGLLQKMFPKDGELFPELRFLGFTDAWEMRKLGDVTNSFSGGTPSVGKSSYYNGEIPFIRSAEINSKSTELFISQEGLNSSSAKIVNAGDILYALYGATSGEVGIAQIEGAINQAILAIQPKENYDSQFIMQWLGGQKQRIIDRFLQGGQGNLSGSIVKDLLIEFPNYQEQQKISAFFKQLDDSITLHQRKLNHLQTRKKALLQQLFV